MDASIAGMGIWTAGAIDTEAILDLPINRRASR
jgi:hypothetical protein